MVILLVYHHRIIIHRLTMVVIGFSLFNSWRPLKIMNNCWDLFSPCREDIIVFVSTNYLCISRGTCGCTSAPSPCCLFWGHPGRWHKTPCCRLGGSLHFHSCPVISSLSIFPLLRCLFSPRTWSLELSLWCFLFLLATEWDRHFRPLADRLRRHIHLRIHDRTIRLGA